MENEDSIFLKIAINKAKNNLKAGSKPFGALIVQNGTIISSFSNKSDKFKDPTAHAELEVIRKASRVLKKKYLQDCVLYTTSEPCIMCLGAILWARIPKVVVGLMRNDIPKDIYNIIYQDSSSWVDKHNIFNYPISVVVCKGSKDCLKLFEEYKDIFFKINSINFERKKI